MSLRSKKMIALGAQDGSSRHTKVRSWRKIWNCRVSMGKFDPEFGKEICTLLRKNFFEDSSLMTTSDGGVSWGANQGHEMQGCRFKKRNWLPRIHTCKSLPVTGITFDPGALPPPVGALSMASASNWGVKGVSAEGIAHPKLPSGGAATAL